MPHLHPSFTRGPFNTTLMAQDVIAMSVSTKVAYLSMVTKLSRKSTLSSRAWDRLTDLRVPMSRRAVSLEEWRRQEVWLSCRPVTVTCRENKTSSQRAKWRLAASSTDSSVGWALIREDWIRNFLCQSTLDPVSSTKKWRPASFNSIETKNKETVTNKNWSVYHSIHFKKYPLSRQSNK